MYSNGCALPLECPRRGWFRTCRERGIFLVNRGLDVCPYITVPALLLLLGSGTVAALTAAAMVLVYPLTVIAALL